MTNPAGAFETLQAEAGRFELAHLFRRGTEIVRATSIDEDGYRPPADPDHDDGAVQVKPATALALVADMQTRFIPFRWVGRGETKTAVQAVFPLAAAQLAVAAPDALPHLRVLRGVTNTPTVRADGSILDRPGYDDTSRLAYLPDRGLTVPPVPVSPTPADVRAAVELLDLLLAGFPFVSDHDRANYLGLLLTPLLRQLAPPPYKLGAIGAPSPGSGKTLLATLLRIVHGGVFRAEWPGDDAEFRKSVTAILDVTTGPVVHFDNLTGVLRSSTLAGLLTSARWDDRRLGSTAMVNAANDRLWVVTGNNLALGGDLVRRTVSVTIDPGIPDPHRRTGFAIDDLERWAAGHRGELLGALLTLVRAWVVAGRPTRGRRGSDGYAAWVETVEGILGHAGIPGRFDDPSAAPEPIGADDTDWADFLRAVHGHYGDRPWSGADLLRLVDTSTMGIPDVARPLAVEVLPTELAERLARTHAGPSSLARPLGMWLRNRAGRWADGYVVRQAGKDRDHRVLWRVERNDGARS